MKLKTKNWITAIALCFIGFSVCQAQDQQENKVRRTVEKYITGRNSGDMEMLRESFHPGAKLKFINNETGDINEWTVEEYLRRFKPGEKLPCTGEIIDVRIFNNAAQATVLLMYEKVKFHDFMNLLRIKDEWLIVDKTFSRLPASPKVLFVVTSHAALGTTGKKSGLNLTEVSHPYKKLTEAGYQIDFVSPKGTVTHIYGQDLNDSTNLWFVNNREGWYKLFHHTTPEKIKAEQYTAIYYAGGHGTMWDIRGNPVLPAIARGIYESGGIVSGICHGSIALGDIRLSDGTFLIANKKVTGFSNAEEKEIELEKVVPVLVESDLKNKGGKFISGSNWTSNVQADQRVISGQNAQSSRALSIELVKALDSVRGN
ncbi:MAG TPA: nuclear transport factor 2 family protein [Chryseosolibacter sp.]